MTTAYTSLLGLALPVQGELQGTWGDTVNNSITSLLDTAVAGTTSITTDADITLTTTTGASNQARQAIILWNPASGTTTRNITAPAQSKVYTVINASGGTQSIVLRGVGPTTGVTIVKGESAVCAWNGSDFIKVSNTSGSGTFTNLTVTGSLTLSGGTANGVAYLNGSKVVTSGSALTFDGTNLGVGTSSPATKLDAAGTIRSTANTNPASGSGAEISWDGTNGSFLAYNRTGSAWLPAQVLGSTAKLIAQTSDVTVSTVAAANALFITNNTERMRLDSSGLLLIGTTSNTGGGRVDAVSNATSAYTARSASSGAGTTVKAVRSVDSGASNFSNAQYDALSHAWILSNSTQAMTLDSSGNLGIGTSSPANKLEISGGSIRTINNTSGRITFNNGTTEAYVGFNGSGASVLDAGALPLNITSQGANYITLNTNSSERMRITSSGNVGIGSLGTYEAKLKVSTTNGASDFSASGINVCGAGEITSGQVLPISFTPIGNDSPRARAAIGCVVGVNWGYGNLAFYTRGAADASLLTTADEKMRIDSSGNVGIGNTSPATNLAVGSAAGSGGNSLGIYLARGATTNLLEAYDGTKTFIGGTDSSNAFVKVGALSNHPVAIVQNNASAIYIDTSKNVGIGTSSPSIRLHVSVGSENTALFQNSSSSPALIRFRDTGTTTDPYIASYGNAMAFGVYGGAESMRIVNGNLGLGVTSVTGGYKAQINGNLLLSSTTPLIVGNSTLTLLGDNTSSTGLLINTSGNVGIGVTPSAWRTNSGEKAIQIGGNYPATLHADGGGYFDIGSNYYLNSSGNFIYTASGSATRYYMAGGGATSAHVWQVSSSGTAGNTISFTSAMTLDASGNLLVGTTDVSGTSGVGFKVLGNRPVTVSNGSSNGTTIYEAYSTGASAYRFYVGMGGTISATSTTITAISDQRLKENIRDLDEGLATVMALKPRKFDWKAGKGKDIKDDRGFIAQEFEQILPDMIEEWKDPAPEGEEPYKAVNANLIPTLVKAIQELKAEFDAYKASHP